MLKSLKNLLLELVFPTFCVNCDAPGKVICQTCYSNILIDYDAQPLKFSYLKGVFVATSLGQEVVEKSIYQFKYNLVKDLGRYLSRVLVDFLLYKINKHYLFDIDLIIPVPLSKKRLLQRGFNQSEILAHGMSSKFGWEIGNKIVSRKHRLKSQVDLGYQDRQKNILKVFTVEDKKFIKDKKILIIDDVLTTGSTISELAKTLKQSGAKEVWALVLARNK